MTPEEKSQLSELLEFKKNLQMSSRIPLAVDQAFRERLTSTLTTLSVSTKGVDTEDVTVNEGGVAIYSVMNDPDGFLEIQIGTTTYYLPYFT